MADSADDGVEFGGDGGAGLVEPGDLGRQGGFVQILRFSPGQDFVHAVGAGHGDPRRDRHAFLHAGTLTAHAQRVNHPRKPQIAPLSRQGRREKMARRSQCRKGSGA